MAKIKYFATCMSTPVELLFVHHTGNYVRAKDFTGTCPACNQQHVCERKVEYKSNPSKHECDARCVRAVGKIMRCECSCGGLNHGKGAQ